MIFNTFVYIVIGITGTNRVNSLLKVYNEAAIKVINLFIVFSLFTAKGAECYFNWYNI